MKKLALVALVTVFAAGSMAAPVLAKAKKAKPGQCGTFMFYDKKTKSCKDKRG